MILKYLDISTSHITENTCQYIETHLGEACSSFAKNYEYGFYIPVVNDIDINTMPEDLRTIIQYAKSKNCSLICIDRDADIELDLPTY